jgi:hypothetical protein
MCLITLSLGGCIIPIHVDEEEPYAEVTAELLADITTKSYVQRHFGKPAATYSQGSEYIYTAYEKNWEIPHFIPRAGGAEVGVATAGKQHFLILNFGENDVLTDLQIDIADDAPGACAETGICHDGFGHIVRLASKAEETKAKEFPISNKQCGIYLYPVINHNTRQTTVTLNGEYMGFVGQWGKGTLTFFFWSLDPGKHEITYYSMRPGGPGPGTLSFTCRESELVFVLLKMKGEVPLSLELVDNSEGRKQIRNSGFYYPKRKLILPESDHSNH